MGFSASFKQGSLSVLTTTCFSRAERHGNDSAHASRNTESVYLRRVSLYHSSACCRNAPPPIALRRTHKQLILQETLICALRFILILASVLALLHVLASTLALV